MSPVARNGSNEVGEEERSASPCVSEQGLTSRSYSLSTLASDEVKDFGLSAMGIGNPEFLIVVVGLCIFLVSIFIVPMGIGALLIRGRYSHVYEWRWVRIEMVRVTWQWSWILSIIWILIMIPLAMLLYEGKEHRDAPLIRRILILRKKFKRFYGNHYLRIPMAVLFLSYVISVYLGWSHPVPIGKWTGTLVRSGLVVVVLFSLIGFPAGILVVFRLIKQIPIDPKSIDDLQVRFEAIQSKIERFETPAPSLKMDKRLKVHVKVDQTPIASKSANSILVSLISERQAIALQLSRNPFKRKLIYSISLFGGLLWLIGFGISMFMELIYYFSTNFLWYFPGIQLVDQIISSLTDNSSINDHSVNVSNGFVIMVFVKDVSMFFYFLLHLFIGSYHLLIKKRPKITLDHLMMIEEMLLILGGVLPILVMMSGVSSDFEMISGEMGSVRGIVPRWVEGFVGSGEGVMVLRFPLMVWLVLMYRFSLIIGIGIVGLRLIKDFFM